MRVFPSPVGNATNVFEKSAVLIMAEEEYLLPTQHTVNDGKT